MKLLKKILLPVNTEYFTSDSFEFAVQLAKLYQSEIIPVHIIAREAEFKSVKEVALNLAKEHIKKVLSGIKKEGLKVGDPIIEYGNHSDRISITALKHNVNVILFGVKKIHPGEGNKLNLTIEKVIRHCDKPVWAVKEGHKKGIKNILCPVDFSETSKRAVLNSIHLAQKFNAKLTLLSVFTPLKTEFPWITGDHSEDELPYKEYKNHFDAYLKNFTFSGINWGSVIRSGEPDQEILKECLDNKYDLLIMGSTGRTGLNRIIMGSVTEKVIRQVPCSFITTKSEDIINLRLETKISNIEHHYNSARQKQKLSLIDEAIGEYQICLTFNDMHIPSLLALSELYGRKGEEDNEALYKKMAHEVVNRLFRDHIKID